MNETSAAKQITVHPVPLFPWPMEKNLNILELETFNQYRDPCLSHKNSPPGISDILSPIERWGELVLPLIELARDIGLNAKEDDDAEEKGLEVFYILQNVTRLFRDFAVLQDVAAKVLQSNKNV